jgi:hypothetical protein
VSLDLAPYSKQVELLVGFVEGRLTPVDLDTALISKEMEALLQLFTNPQYPHSTNYYFKLIEQERNSLGGLVNTEGLIENYLALANIPHQATRRYGKAYSLILGALPDYLDPSIEFLLEKVVPTDETLSDSKKKQLIKERLQQLFKHAGKPPKWLQSAEWPIENGVPLYFIGQLKISAPSLFHDDGMAYLFFDSANGGFQTITQFY